MKNTSKTPHGIAHLLIIIIVLATLIGGLVLYALSKPKSKEGASEDPAKRISALKDDCAGSGLVTMKNAPMDMQDVASVVPAGTLAGAHVTPIDHLYFYPKDMQNRDAAPVYAMADGYIVSYQERTQRVDNGAQQKGEYRIDIQHNCDVFSYFDLMTSLDPSIKDKVSSKENGKIRVPVKAGQVLGRVGAQSLDTAIYNYSTTLTGFVNTKTYDGEPWKIHLDDFFKYFKDPIRSEMLAKNERKVEPYGGKIDYDIDGKLVGNWFEEGTNGYAGPKEFQAKPGVGGKGYWSGHLSIAPDAITPKNINISFGEYQGEAKQFRATTSSPDPKLIGVESGLTKYEYTRYTQQGGDFNPTGGVMQGQNQVLGTVLFQLTETQKLKMEYFPGKMSSQVSAFTGSAKIYVR